MCRSNRCQSLPVGRIFACWVCADSAINHLSSTGWAVVRLRLIEWMRLFRPGAVDDVAQVNEGDHHRIQLEALSVPSRDCERDWRVCYGG